MKKITTFALFPVIALSSCLKNDENSSIPSPQNPPSVNLENNNIQNVPLNPQINSGVTDSTGIKIEEFKLTYNLPDGRPLKFNGNIEIENGKIKSLHFPELNLNDEKSYDVKFAKKMQSDLIGKEIKGLQYDGMTGASLTTNAFNTYLNTINK